MKTIVIFCRTVDPNGYPFNETYYWHAYIDLLLALKSRGVQAYFATDNNTYKGNGVFATAYTTDAKRPVSEFEVATNIKADLVYEKGGFTASDVFVLNPEFIRSIATKTETYKHFRQYQPLTIVCDTKQQVLDAFDRVKGARVVVKEPEGHGGHAVYIGSREDVLAKLPDSYPLLVQEFMDTSVGISGLVEGIHDIRVEIAGGTVLGGVLRTPAKGELRANVAQGGTERYLLPDELPTPVVELALKMDEQLSDYPRHYAADFANTPEGWKLIELNSKPGLSPVDSNPQAKHVSDGLADYLVEICPSSN